MRQLKILSSNVRWLKKSPQDVSLACSNVLVRILTGTWAAFSVAELMGFQADFTLTLMTIWKVGERENS